MLSCRMTHRVGAATWRIKKERNKMIMRQTDAVDPFSAILVKRLIVAGDVVLDCRLGGAV